MRLFCEEIRLAAVAKRAAEVEAGALMLEVEKAKKAEEDAELDQIQAEEDIKFRKQVAKAIHLCILQEKLKIY